MESTIYIFIVVYLLGDIASIYLPKISKNCIANEMYQNFRSFIYLSIIQAIHLFSFILFFFLFSFQNACGKNLPCQNNATCQSGFTIKGYRCSCPPGFEGEHCEKG